MQIRVYREDDFDGVYRLDQSCYPRGIAYSRFVLHAFLAEPGAQGFVAEEEGAIIGFVLVRRVSAEQGHVITLDVHADYRRRGLGTALLAQAEQWLRQQGVTRVHLETSVDSEAAVAFWQKTGYRQRGLLRGYYLDRINAYVMEKELLPLATR